MSTLEELQAEAEELYPPRQGVMLDGGPFPRLERGAHVHAKTITAEQVRKAAMTMHNLTVDTPWGECSLEVKADLAVMRASFEAAGFYVEEES